MKTLYTIFFLLLSAGVFAQSNVVPDAVEFQALKDLWESTNGSSWTNKTNWPTSGNWPSGATSSQFGTWYGVTVTNGDITQIALSTNNLTGEIPSSIGNLTALGVLGFQFNKLTGSVPSSLGNLTKLSFLYLNNNQLSGTVPDVFTTVNQLRYFSVANNSFTGPLPATLGTSTFMTAFSATNNKFTGSIPSTYSGFTLITNFYVDINDLSGEIPSYVSGWTKLTNFVVKQNRFSGTLPSGFSSCPLLSMIDVSKNNFSGAFPSVPTTYLSYAAGNDNSFTSLPNSLTSGLALTQVYFQNNNITTVPDFGTYSNRTNLILNLSSNRLDFSKLEPHVGKGIKTLTQTPQKNVNDVSTTPVSVGTSLTITARPLGTGTTINWEKLSPNGSAWTSVDSKDDDGSANNTFKRDSPTADDEGAYRWKTTSSVVTGLTIYSDPISVKTAQGFIVDNWAFQYKYDGRKRMIQKKVPGADWVYMVYDDRDRLVMTQDGEQRKNNRWSATRYDALNRPVATAIYTHSSYVTQVEMDSIANATTSFVPGQPYDNTPFPFSSSRLNILTQTFYDNYDFLKGDQYFDYKPGQLTGQRSTASTRLKGLVTGTWTSVLGKDKQWLRTVNYYDDKNRVIQAISDNHKRGQDVTTNVYDFVGKVTDTKTESIDHHITWTAAHASSWILEDRVVSRGGATTVYAFSTQQLAQNTDGWVEYTCSDSTLVSTRSLGFSTSTTASQIGFGVKQNVTATSNTAQAMVGTTAKASVAVRAGDVIRIERKGTTMYYKKNGVAFDSTTSVTQVPLYAHTTLLQTNAELFNPKISIAGASRSIQRHFDYDHAGRLINTYHSLDNGPLVLLSKQQYNELGQVVDKKLHSTDETNFHQSIDYRYNIRGWLTSMNGADLGENTSKNEDDVNERRDLFGIDLLYNETNAGIGNDELYNGNISAMRWSNNLGLGSTKERAYKFDYDAMNRLNAASQYTTNGITWNTSTAFHESGITYDLNGNIKTLNRTDAAGAVMDHLDYDYGSDDVQSNMLLKVTDSGSKDGFNDALGGDNDYVYDRNGNLVSDNNKSIRSISYNYLNLPETVTKTTNEYLTYTYDATGRKLYQDVYTNTGLFKKRSDYRGEWFYENDTLRFVNHEEGRAVTEGDWSQAPQLLADSAMASTANYLATGGSNVTITAITQNSKSYIKVLSNATAATPGFFSNFINVSPGRSYTLRVKGYSTGPVVALYVYGMGYLTSDVLWRGTQLPQGSTNEAWVESTFTVPATVSRIQVGARWSTSVSTGDAFYINTMELYEYNGIHGNTTFAQTGYTYQYHLKDHLGNVRMTFTTKDESEESIANFEEPNSDFLYYDEAVKINSTIFDHTDTATTHYSARLNGTPTERFGVARSLSVMPGDTINMQVFAKYLNPDTTTWTTPIGDLMTSILNGSAPLGTFIDGGMLGSTGGLLFPFWSLFSPEPDNDNEDAPKAYLNWLVFDRNYILKDGGALQVSTAAEEHGQNGNHEELSKQLAITEAGFVYVYLSNDNYAINEEMVEVYFDDFKVEHIKSPVIESQSYYPFGLTHSLYQRENSLANQYQYNSKELQDELNLGWLDYGARMYMPDIGRWGVIDPYAHKYEIVTPYSYAFSNPMLFIDPTGKENTIYLVGAGKFSSSELRKTEQMLNKFFAAMGLETRAKVFNEKSRGAFDESKLDKTDNWAVMGTDKKAISEKAMSISGDKDYDNTLKGWGENGGAGEPEVANNKSNGKGIVVDYDDTVTKLPETQPEGAALTVMHGAGHSSERIQKTQGTLDLQFGHLDQGVMQEGNRFNSTYRRSVNGGAAAILAPNSDTRRPGNDVYIKGMMERYGTKKAVDNYSTKK